MEDRSGGFRGWWCVLAHRPDNPPPVAVLRALEERGFEVRQCAGAFDALSLATVLDGRAGGSGGVLLLHDPSRIGRASELVDAARAYLPAVRCWMLDPKDRGAPELRAVSEADAQAWQSPEAGGRIGSGAAGGRGSDRAQNHALRSASPPVDTPGSGSGGRSGEFSDPGGTRPLSEPRGIPADGGLLSEEELALLLADDPADA